MSLQVRILMHVIIFVSMFLVLSCASIPPPASLPTAPSLLNDFIKKRDELTSLRARSSADSFSDGQRIRGKVDLFLTRPDRLRVELVSPFESPLAILVADKDRFAMHDMRKGRFLVGKSEPCNIERLLKVPLTNSQVIMLFLGGMPIIDFKYSIVRWDSRGYYSVDLIDDDGRVQRLEIDPNPQCYSLMRSTLTDSKGLVFEIIMEGKAHSGAKCLPEKIRVILPRKDTDVLLSYTEAEINVNLPDIAWKLDPPAGIIIEPVECEYSEGQNSGLDK